jgi:sugar lactone lactonase YvrE
MEDWMNCTKRTLLTGFGILASLFVSVTSYGQVILPANGFISTIAGSLNSPGGVAIDHRNGTIYFTDGSSPNRVVKKIDPVTGIITVYAGGGWFVNQLTQMTVNGVTRVCGRLSIGEGGAATSAMLESPVALAVDQSGNLYIADVDDNSVFKVTTDGIIHTLVGNGCPFDTGDTGLAANAMIDMPMGVAVDSSGNVFVSAWYDNYVRKIDTSGNINIYAGVPYDPDLILKGILPSGYCGNGVDATQAILFAPAGLAVDSTGVLYIADSDNGRIRKVVSGSSSSPSSCTGLIGTSGHMIYDVTGSLNIPTGVAFDTKGNLYIADAGNNRIQEMLLSLPNTPIYTVVGNGIPGFAGDGGLATSAELGGSDFLEVSNLALDATNHLYIGDTTNNSIRAVGPSTIMSASCSPNPIAYGSDTTCTATLSANGSTGTVTWSIDGSAWQTHNLSGSSDPIYGFTTESTGTHAITAAYSGDSSNSSGIAATTLTIKSTQTITFTAPTSPVIYGAAPIALSATATSGLPVAFGIVSGPGTVIGSTLTITGPGTIVVAANQAGSATYMPVSQVTRTVVVNYALPAHGLITTIAGNGIAGYTGDGGPGTKSELNSPWGVTVDRSGNIYIADANNVAIRAISYTNGYIYTEAGSGLGGDGVAVDTYGDFFIANTGSNRLLEGVPSNGTINYYLVAGNMSGTAGFGGDGGTGPNALLNGPQGVAIDASGNLYLADTKNNRIRKVMASNLVITTVVGNGVAGYTGDNGVPLSAEINAPYGVAIDASGNIYIADTSNNRIRKLTLSTGKITTVAGSGTYGFSGDGGAATAAQLYMPTGVAVDSAGNIYIADFGNNRVRMVTLSTLNISTVAGNGTAGFSGDGGAATSAALYRPAGVSVDASGNLYIADTNNNRVRVVGH